MNRREGQRVRARGAGRRRAWWLACWTVYVALVAASLAWESVQDARGVRGVRGEGAVRAAQAPIEGDVHAFTCPDFTDEGDAGGAPIRVAYESWGESGRGEPVVLVHGSPGAGRDFGRMAEALAEQGRWVLAPDLPGFGRSTRRPASYSTRAHARAVLALMDHVGAERAHVLGWSMGGGVVLHMAELAPGRVASITMLAAIGDQRVEGSGSYAFEHAKYALGRVGLVAGRAMVPSFGLLPDARESMLYSTMRNFGDTDMRAHRAIMESLRTPTLIIAGRDDFLVHLRAPVLHHELIRPSRLVVLDAMHFMPFMQAEQTAGLVGRFIDEDAPKGAGLERSAVWEVPPREPPLGAVGAFGARVLELAPWWVVVIAGAALVWQRPFLGAAVVAALVNALVVDWGVGMMGVFAGVLGHALVQMGRGIRGARGYSRIDWARRLEQRRPPAGFWLGVRAVFRPDWRVIAPRAVGALGDALGVLLFGVGCVAGAAAWMLVQMLSLLAVAALIAQPLRDALGWAGSAVSLLVLWMWARSFVLVFTWTGRRVLVARVSKVWRHEYWPSWIYYAPLAVYVAVLAVRHRHLLAFTACNPGIPRGGGTIGESKQEVMDRIRPPAALALPSVRIEAGATAEERAAAALRAIGPGTAVGDFPVILKPDAGQRGFAVRLARDASQVRSYFETMTRAAVVQKYHPGPGEVGVLWARDRGGTRAGFVYSVTRKEFPYVEGDGRRTLEELIYRHRRHRRQAGTFLARLADEASSVPAAGERVRLAQSGNHCQGTLFRDGGDLVTPELTAALTRLALGEEGEGDKGIDIGRFDLRYASEEELRRGRGFGVIEFNGATGESTNIYDPERSVVWSWRVLLGQWRLLYELGTWRRAQGVEAWTVRRLAREVRTFYRDRPGSAVAD